MECDSASRYVVRLCDGLLGPQSPLVEAIGQRTALLITTPTVDRLYGRALRALLGKSPNVSMLVLSAREETKSLGQVERVCAEALSRRIDRRGVLVAVGGRVCSDVVTLAASMIRRGIAHLRVPTTLIGQIDAGVGLKGAVNFGGKKSFVGCFHPPEQVLIDPVFLRSLPHRAVSSGLGEAIKMGIARDAALFDALERHAHGLVASGFGCGVDEERSLLRRSIWAMLEELRKNPWEDQGYERIVDFGHTFSPLLEAALGFELQHGEAVAVDMALCTRIATGMGLLSAHEADRILALLRTASLPIFSPRLDLALCRHALAEACRHRGGALNLPVPAGIGRTRFLRRREELPDEVLAQALQELATLAEGDA